MPILKSFTQGGSNCLHEFNLADRLFTQLFSREKNLEIRDEKPHMFSLRLPSDLVPHFKKIEDLTVSFAISRERILLSDPEIGYVNNLYWQTRNYLASEIDLRQIDSLRPGLKKRGLDKYSLDDSVFIFSPGYAFKTLREFPLDFVLFDFSYTELATKKVDDSKTEFSNRGLDKERHFTRRLYPKSDRWWRNHFIPKRGEILAERDRIFLAELKKKKTE